MKKSELVLSGNKAYHLGIAKEHISPYIFLVGDPKRSYKLAAHFDSIDFELKNREFITLTGAYQGIPMTVIGTGIGTDNTEIVLSELFSLHEFDLVHKTRIPNQAPLHIIRVGSSAGVQAHIASGTLAISSYALGLDNTGLYYDHDIADAYIPKIEAQALEILNKSYQPGSRFEGKIFPYASKSSPRVVDALTDAAQSADLPFAQGITASSPGFYGPSARYLDGLRNSIPRLKHVLAELKLAELQVINMDMESSILFHICHQLAYPAASICPIISNPYSSDDIIDYAAVIEQAIQVALSAMKNLAQNS